MEVWKDVKGYEGLYQVSSEGNLKSLDRISNFNGDLGIRKGKKLKLSETNDGYYRNQLYKNGKRENFYIHRLVAKAFIPKVDGKFHINHIDGNPKNNRVENLEWCTPKENTAHAYQNGLMPYKYSGDGEDIVSDYNSGKDMREIAKKYSIYHTTVKKILVENGVEIIRKKKKLLRTPEEIRMVVELRDKGFSFRRIAVEMGVSRPTIQKLLDDVRCDEL